MKQVIFTILNLAFLSSLTAQVVTNTQIVGAPPRVANEMPASSMIRQAPNADNNLPNYGTNTVTSQKIGSSANYYGYANNGQKQMYLQNDINSLAFVFRVNPSLTGAVGLRYNVSDDRGLTWKAPVTGVGLGSISPNQTSTLGSPNCFLFTHPTTSGTTADARLGILSNGGGANGYAALTVAPNIYANATPTLEQEDYNSFLTGLFTQHITERVPGEFWATMYSSNINNDSIYVMKGTYNSTLTQMDWTINDRLLPLWNTASNGSAHWLMPKIEFSPNGTVGYIAVFGDLIGGQDSIYTPILWDYNPVTGHFSGGYEVNINQFPVLNTYIHSFVDVNGQTLSNGKVSCAFNFDLTVDYNGNPHIMCIVAPASSGMYLNPDDYNISANFGLKVMDITKDNAGFWKMIHIADQLRFRENLTGTTNVSIDPSMNLARTQDGKYVFYTWSDTDTTGNFINNGNNSPNLKGAFLDVQNSLISPTTDWTYNDVTWGGKAHGPKTTSRVFEAGGSTCPGRSFNVPTTVFALSAYPDPSFETDFYYFSNINYNCQDATIAVSQYIPCVASPIATNVSTVQPACGQNTGSISLNATGGIGSIYTYSIADPAGNILSTNNSASNLGANVYLVTIQDEYGCNTVETVSLNNLNAAVPSISNVVNPTCNNSSDGEMTVCWTGGTSPMNIVWAANGVLLPSGVTTGTCNSNTNLPNGTIAAVMTDASGCVSSISNNLTSVLAITFQNAIQNVTCNGINNGAITVNISNGNGTATYLWTGPMAIGNINNPTGLAVGTYNVVVTQGVCSEQATFTIVQPAPIIINMTTITQNTNCAAPYNGMICVSNVTGGVIPYYVSWTALSGAFPYIPTPDSIGPGCLIELPGGAYTAYISDFNGCTVSNTLTLSGCQVGIENHLSNITQFQAFPNPASDVLQVKMSLQKEDDVSISLVNIAGQNILQKNILHVRNIQESFYINGLAKGIYFLKIQTSQGVAAEKIVIE